MGLERSRSNRMIAGVCAGIAKNFNLDPTLVRILFVLVSIFSAAFPGIIVYVILWIVLPEEGTATPPPSAPPPSAPPPVS